jgi:hypothetical protein
VTTPADSPTAYSGIAAVDAYLDEGFTTVPGMSSRFAGAIAAGLMNIQTKLGVTGPVAEIGTFQGRFFIALAKALQPGEIALGMDTFDWPNPQVQDRFEANCVKHGIPAEVRRTWKCDSRTVTPAELLAHTDGTKVRLIHVDGDHGRASLAKDLLLATAVLADDGVIILDDILHPAYPTLMVTVHEYLAAHPGMVVLCIIDRETIVAATKFVLCRAEWFKRYEAELMKVFEKNIWPLGADFEPHWCLVLSLDTRLAVIT